MQEETMGVFSGKRVLMIVGSLPCPFETRAWQEATTLKDCGANVTIICPTGKGYENNFEIIDGIVIYRHNLIHKGDGALSHLLKFGSALFWEFVLAMKCHFTRGFDVIHVSNPPDFIYMAAKPFKLLGKKLVFDQNDIYPELYISKYGTKGFLHKLMLYFEKRAFKCSEVSIDTNDSYREIALKRGGKRPEDVFVVRSAPSFERLQIIPPIEELKNGRKFMIGYVGFIEKHEGLNYLVDAADYIINVKKRRDIQFTCVGGGSEISNIRKYVREKCLEKYFTFTGRVSDRVLLEYLNTADVCVNPAEYNEMNDKATMNKVMEYMALGKPIVQFDLTEGKFTAGEASLYANRNDTVDMAEKITVLLDDEELRNKMGAIGRERIEKELNWEIEKHSLIKAYNKVFFG